MAARRLAGKRSKRDRFAGNGTYAPMITPMTAQVPTSKVISFAKYKAIVRDQIIRFSAGFKVDRPDEAGEWVSGRITSREAMGIVNQNEARIREAYERGLPSRRVATSLIP